MKCPERGPEFLQKVKGAILNKNHVSLIIEVREMILRCASLGENLFQLLKRLNHKIKLTGAVDDVFEKIENKGEKHKSYTTFDFMGNRTLLSNILKTKAIFDISQIGYNRKNVTSVLNQFILDRK